MRMVKGFVGREKELASLEKLYQKDKFECIVLYGRRRIGKTTLISKFIEGKPAIFYTAQEASDRINLEAFSRKVYQFFDVPETAGAFESWNTAFSFLAEKARQQRFVLAFDEFPYAATANTALPSILQNAIDHEFRDTGMYLILCGSHVGFMENEVLGYKSPLFGRRTAQIKLEALDYLDASRMLPGFTNEEKILLYGCIGGTPHYLAQVDNDVTFEENIASLFFDISGYLYREPMMLLQQELREPAMYNSIISAIASGASRISDIANRLGEDNTKIGKYLRTILNLQLAVKKYPFGDNPETSKKAIYALADNCYLFWYRFVFPAIPEIESGSGDIIAKRLANSDLLSQYMGKNVFEDVCLQFLRRKNRQGELPFLGTSFGSWWGNDVRLRRENDIDVIMADRETKQALLGECKWKNSAPDKNDILNGIEKDYLLKDYQTFYHCFFSKTAYEDKIIRELGSSENAPKLYVLDDLFH
ncbi:MAG: ATP-binding protein [Eubacteriales bacterium]|nr:ATP-binding protein [Eubacteriales bacterium]